MNGEPVSALALVVIPYGPEDKVRTNSVTLKSNTVYFLEYLKCSPAILTAN